MVQDVGERGADVGEGQREDLIPLVTLGGGMLRREHSPQQFLLLSFLLATTRGQA